MKVFLLAHTNLSQLHIYSHNLLRRIHSTSLPIYVGKLSIIKYFDWSAVSQPVPATISVPLSSMLTLLYPAL